MNYLKKIIIFFLIGISVNCKEIARINNNNIRDDKNRLNMEIEKDEKIKILKTKQKLSLVSKVYSAPNFIISNYSFLVDKNKIKEFITFLILKMIKEKVQADIMKIIIS